MLRGSRRRRSTARERRRAERHGRRLVVERVESRWLLALTVPVFHSFPSAPATLYLDFDGHFQASWGSYQNVSTPVYDRDGDPSDFSATEIAEISEIWARVAEDYAPFNIDVTTEDPGDFSNQVGLRVAIGGHYNDWYGMTESGTAWINSFWNPLPNVVYVFEDVLDSPRRVADIAAHEPGHAFGLFHQGLYDESGVQITEYNPGDPPDWAPLMGNPLLSTRSTWHYGPTYNATHIQDDVAVIAGASNGFGFRADDHGDIAGAATPLDVVGTQLGGAGIIGQLDDLDYFAFSTEAGEITVTANVAQLGPNLDAKIELRAADDSFIAMADPPITSGDPPGGLSASITTTVAAGDYYLVVTSHGTYGDLGQYTISGSIAAANSPPVADAGGPYVLDEGDSLVLDASGSFDPDAGAVLTYSWDVNGDGVFGDATGETPTLTWPDLIALGLGDGDVTVNTSVRVDDGQGGITDSPPVTTTLFNAVPSAGLSGPSTGVRGQPLSFMLLAGDASPDDQADNFTFEIDWDNDTVVDETILGPSGTLVTHVFADSGSYDVYLTATDKDGGASSTIWNVVDVALYELVPDAAMPELTNLVVGGTISDDTYRIVDDGNGLVLQMIEGGQTAFEVDLDGVSSDGVDGKIIVFGYDGDDLFDGAAGDNTPIEFHGGDGNDTAIGGAGDDSLFGNGGDDVLVGQNGGDQIDGGSGNDVAIGGSGADTLIGGSGEDVLFADDVLFAADIDAITAIALEWTSAHSYSARTGFLLGAGDGGKVDLGEFTLWGDHFGQSGQCLPGDFNGDGTVAIADFTVWADMYLAGNPFNGSYFLESGTTAFKDSSVDTIFGGDDQDLFLYDSAQDLINDLEGLENVVDLYQ